MTLGNDTYSGDFEQEPEVSNDPFAPENIGVVQFIQMSRIYDALMLLLTEMNPEAAKNLLESHQKGHLFTPMPLFDGTFITDELNK